MLHLLLLTWIQTVSASGPNCRAVDLRSQLGKPRHQGESGWCFAHTTADLISLKAGVRVSAFDIATTFLLSKVDPLLRSSDSSVRDYLGQHPDFAIRLNEARQDDKAYAPDQILSANGLLNVGGVEDIALVLANTKGLCRDQNLPGDDEPGHGYGENLAAIQEFFSAISPVERRQLKTDYAYLDQIRSSRARARAGAFQTWVDHRCGRRVPALGWIPKQHYIAKDADALDRLHPQERKELAKALHETIDHRLNEGRAIAIGYDANEIMVRDEGDRARHADHSSLIAARRESPTGCEYFVRNSFGQSCEDYLSPHQKNCEQGGVWVTLTQLQSLYSAVWID